MDGVKKWANKPARRIIDEMQRGDTCDFPIEKMSSIRVVCSELKTTNPGRGYTTTLDRDRGKIIVTRVE